MPASTAALVPPRDYFERRRDWLTFDDATERRAALRSVFLTINAATKHLGTRVADAALTWLRDFDDDQVLVCVSGEPDAPQRLPPPVRRLRRFVVPGPDSYGHAQNRFLRALLEAHRTAPARFEWLMLVDDDGYVVTRGLARLLPQLDATLDAYYGQRCKVSVEPGKSKCCADVDSRYYYFCGGGGVLFPRRFFGAIADELARCFEARSTGGVYDVRVSACVWETTHVQVTDVAGFHSQVPRHYTPMYGPNERYIRDKPGRRVGDIDPVTFHYVHEHLPHELFVKERHGLPLLSGVEAADHEGGYTRVFLQRQTLAQLRALHNVTAYDALVEKLVAEEKGKKT